MNVRDFNHGDLVWLVKEAEIAEVVGRWNDLSGILQIKRAGGREDWYVNYDGSGIDRGPLVTRFYKRSEIEGVSLLRRHAQISRLIVTRRGGWESAVDVIATNDEKGRVFVGNTDGTFSFCRWLEYSNEGGWVIDGRPAAFGNPVELASICL